MKVEKLDRDNIKEFIKNLSVTDNSLENKVSKIDYYGVKDENTYYLAFVMLPEDDRIAIKYINNHLSEDKFIECINYLKNSLVVKNHLIVQIYDSKFMDILNEKYRVKDIYISLKEEDNFLLSEELKEKYAEIDMYNIRYLYSKKNIICNLVKQNIQDEDIINRLHSYLNSLNVENISFIVNDISYETLKDYNYKCIYRSYVIEWRRS